MSHDSDPWPEAFADQIIKRLTEHFDARHDEHTRLNRELNQRLEAVEERLDELGLLGGEIQRGTDFIQELARGTWGKSTNGQPAPPPPRPEPGTPRPQAIDDACAIPAGEPAQEVRLPRYGMVLVPEPGSDPAAVWAHLQSSNTEGSAHGLRGTRRTRRR